MLHCIKSLRSGGDQPVVLVVARVPAAAGEESSSEREVHRDQGEDRRGEDPHAELPPEGCAAQAEGGGRGVGVELGGGGLDERRDEALPARGETAGAAELGEDELHLRERKRRSLLAVCGLKRKFYHQPKPNA